ALVPVVLALLYVAYEFSYDRHNENFHRIYRVVDDTQDFIGSRIINPVLPNPVAKAMKDEFPEIELAARMSIERGTIFFNNRPFFEENILLADPDFLKIFTFNFVQGNPATVLNEPFSVCLSESTAKKYFGNKNPMGMRFYYMFKYELTVRGIYKDMPENSHFTADMIIPTSETTGNYGMGSQSGITNPNQAWGLSMFNVYFLLKKNANIDDVERKYQSFLKRHQHTVNSSLHPVKYFSQPLGDIHLKSDIYSRPGERSLDKIYLYLTMALVILLIASINYVNLTSARFSQRVKEISIRKILGADRKQLLRQLLTETFVLSMVSLGITLCLIMLIFKIFAVRDFHLPTNMFAGILGLVLLISIPAGLYPASLAFSISPLAFFRGKGISLKKTRSRNILIIVQFVFTIVLVYCAFSVKNQINYMTEKDPGYRKDNIVTISLGGNFTGGRFAALKNEILKSSSIISASVASCRPDNIRSAWRVQLPGEYISEKNHVLWYGSIDSDFIDLYEMKITKGRKFLPSDNKDKIILNETAAKAFGWKDPVGKNIIVSGRGRDVSKYVVGIIKDFHFQLMNNRIEPMFFCADSTERMRDLSIKIRGGNVQKALSHIQSVFKSFNTAGSINRGLLDAQLEISKKRDYRTEFRLLYIFSVFSAFTLLISCLGLFGLVSFTTEVRSKEVGIRKVLGASVIQVSGLFIKEILKLILISAAISAPVAFFIMDKWLSDFPYRTCQSPWVFLFSTGVVMAVAVLSLAFQVLRAAMQNPVNSIKYE
ncbi:MAG: FtsX-like permease family protein, partial [Ignavibacteriales bacterium]